MAGSRKTTSRPQNQLVFAGCLVLTLCMFSVHSASAKPLTETATTAPPQCAVDQYYSIDNETCQSCQVIKDKGYCDPEAKGRLTRKYPTCIKFCESK
jgi:hypothetical protein